MSGLERIDTSRPDLENVLQAVHDFAESMAGPDTRICEGAQTHPSMNQLRKMVDRGMPLYVRWDNDSVVGFATFTSDGKNFLWGRDAVEATSGYGAEYDQRVADVVVMAYRDLGTLVEDVAGVSSDEWFPGAMRIAHQVIGG